MVFVKLFLMEFIKDIKDGFIVYELHGHTLLKLHL